MDTPILFALFGVTIYLLRATLSTVLRDGTRAPIVYQPLCLVNELGFPAVSRAWPLRELSVLEKLATIQMLDVCFPTTDGRWLIMPRYTQPEPEQMLLLHQLHLSLPPQPPPRIKPSEQAATATLQLKM